MMTIALGALCVNGLVIAADTNVVMDDGSKSQTMKVETLKKPEGGFVIANAAMDGNAAKTLVSNILADIKGNHITDLAYFESLLTDRMTLWASAHSKPPSVQFVVGASLGPVPEHRHDLRIAALYFCEPPNTVVRKTEHDDSDGYVAIGSGAAVTDPLHKILFRSWLKSPRVRLAEVAYLMCRAKADNALCGGRTTAVFLRDRDQEPIRITPVDMQFAEDHCGTLDYLLGMTADAVITQTDESVVAFSNSLASQVVNVGTKLRNLKFHSLSGEVMD